METQGVRYIPFTVNTPWVSKAPAPVTHNVLFIVKQ